MLLFSARIPESVFKDLQNEEDFEDIRQEQEKAAAAKTSKPISVAKSVEDTVKTSTPSSVRNGGGVDNDPSSVSEASVRPPSAVAEAGGLEEAAAQEEEEDNSFDGLFHAFDAGMVKYHDNTTNNPLDNLKG